MIFRMICVAAAWALVVAPAGLFAQTDSSNQCAVCHADLKKLMRLCWKIEKMRPKAQASSETSGEG